MAQTDTYARLIEQHIPEARAHVVGEGGKFEATVISEAFAGKNLLAKHRMVYSALDAHIKSGAIHALSIRAYTPAEWGEVGEVDLIEPHAAHALDLVDGDLDGADADDVRDVRPGQALDDLLLGRLVATVELLVHGDRDLAVLEGLSQDVLVADGDEQPLVGRALP